MSESQVTPEEQSQEKPESQAKSAAAAKSVGRRVVDVLVIGVCLIMLAALGLELRTWWQNDEAPAERTARVLRAAVGNDPLAGADAGLDVRFGGASQTMHRARLFGTPAQRQRAAVERASELLVRAELFPSRMGEGERRLIARTGHLDPVRESAGGRKLFLIKGPFVLLAGVVPADGSDTDQKTERLALWGALLPDGEESSTLLLCRGGTASASDAKWPTMPVPRGTTEGVRLQSPQGGILMSVSGLVRLDDLRAEVAAHFDAEGWTALDGWTVEPPMSERVVSSRCRFVPHKIGSRAAPSPGFIDVTFTAEAKSAHKPTEPGMWRGLILATPVVTSGDR